MANPKRKHTHSRTTKRRANWKVGNIPSSKCPNCKSLNRPHQVCSVCGFYGDKVEVPVKEKKKDKETPKK
ncbi:MAG TPA: 50S ribosomal protein L32 [Elusimicrobiales bacterium]|nr:50S ribosomal protein L32 [Elusimicrobiales bacterium]